MAENKSKNRPQILCIDDDPSFLSMVRRFLENAGYNVLTAGSGEKGLKILNTSMPDLILLDIQMPEMDGYVFCQNLQRSTILSTIPLLFLSVLGAVENEAKAFSLGAVGYLTKPVNKNALLSTVGDVLSRKSTWENLADRSRTHRKLDSEKGFNQFKQFVSDKLNLDQNSSLLLNEAGVKDLFSVLGNLGVSSKNAAMMIADFTRFDALPFIDPETVAVGLLPLKFCKSNLILPIKDLSDKPGFVLCNPFDLELIDLLKRHFILKKDPKFYITNPENILTLLEEDLPGAPGDPAIGVSELVVTDDPVDTTIRVKDTEERPIVFTANKIIRSAIEERASDIHFEPKQLEYLVRYRIDGDVQRFSQLKKETGAMVISRLKTLSGLDIAERRKPQDGSFEARINKRIYKFRLATSSTPDGESLIIRILEPGSKPKTFSDLGMTPDQIEAMKTMTARRHGLILMAGPTGSGKTTTIYSLLGNIDCKTKSLITVEDPIEYEIADGNQQQVNEKAGVTFEALLRSSVRQDPDILFIGEIRDPLSARIAIDFSSTGHLTISSLHTTNATSSIFRLERLNVSREEIADAVVGIISQRLLKKLCPHCRTVKSISREESDLLKRYTSQIPDTVAHPEGCYRCNQTGYFGREGVYEILLFDKDTRAMVRSDRSIDEIRNAAKERGAYWISDHVLEKINNHIVSIQDAYIDVLVEESPLTEATHRIKAAEEKNTSETSTPSILIVDDDAETLELFKRLLTNSGYNVTTAGNAIDALLTLNDRTFDLILSDIGMQDIDGLKFFEILLQRGINTPLVFLTSLNEEEAEIRALKLGASDFIRKPVKKDVLRARVQKVLDFPRIQKG